MMIAGTIKDLMAAVHLAADGSQIATGTIFCVVRLESDDADDGKFWDSDDDTWQAAPVAWPTGTPTQAGQWVFALPAAATTGKVGDTIHHTFTDDLDEALATTVCGGGEHRVFTTQFALDALVGARQITIHTQDQLAADLPNTEVSIYSADNATFITRGKTNSGGDLVVALDDGVYMLRFVKDLHSFAVPVTLVVVADATENFTGTAFVPSLPSAPNFCVVFGTARDVGGVVLRDALVTARAVTPQVVSNIQLAKRFTSTTTDANGKFEIELEKNTTVRFVVAGANLDVVRKVPDADEQNLATWV